MKKCEFYTLIRQGSKPVAVKVNGYTDGTYNYYSQSRGNWMAIDPRTGLGVIKPAGTLKKAEAAAHEFDERLADLRSDKQYYHGVPKWPWYWEVVDQFDDVRTAAIMAGN